MPPYVSVQGNVVDLSDGHVIGTDEVRQIVADTAIAEGIDPDLALAVVNQESGFNVGAVGDNGNSHGLFQENVNGRGYGLNGDIDPVAQTQRFAADVRAFIQANPGASPGQIAAGVQRPYDPVGYQQAIDSALGGGNVAGPDSPHTDSQIGPIPTPGALAPLSPADIAKIEKQANANGNLTPWQAKGTDYNTWAAQTRAAGGAAEAQAAADLQRTIASTGQIGASNQNASNSLAEQRRQFDVSNSRNESQFKSNQDFERAKFNENYALDQGKTLLGLGSRPDTLIKYLYAIRGQQTPQAVAGTTTNLPGFQNVVGQPNPQPTTGGQAPTSNPVMTPGGAAPAPAAPGLLPSPAGGTPGPGNNAPAGTSLIPGTPYVGAPGAGAPAPSPSTGGMTIPGTSMTQGRSSTFDNAAQVQQALAPGISIGMGNGVGPSATPPLHVGGNTPVPAGVTEDPNFQAFRQSYANAITGGNISAQQAAAGPRAMGPGGIAIYKSGGRIPEPVLGVGMHSGQHYLFGEAGPEHVVPGAGSKPAPPLHGTNAYADGGTIGYNPIDATNALNQSGSLNSGQPNYNAPPPGGGSYGGPAAPAPAPAPTGMALPRTDMTPGATIGAGGLINQGLETMPTSAPAQNYNAPLSPNVFNPTNLPSIVARGYNSSPQTPLFPNVGIATNGGQSLIPSAQRYNSLLPSEQQNYSGALQDEFGVQPQDIYSIMQKLMPHISGLHTPRFAS